MGRPRKPDPARNISLRLPDTLLAEIDQVTQHLRDTTPLMMITRTETIRYMIRRFLHERRTA